MQQREQWEAHNIHKRSTSHRRHKRSISVERHVEAMVVVDPTMMDYYREEDVTTYVLTIMNMVRTDRCEQGTYRSLAAHDAGYLQ